MTEKLLTTAEVATQLGISEQHVEQLVLEGRLVAYRLGGKYLRFRPEQVQRLALTVHETAPTPTVAAGAAAAQAVEADELAYTWPERVRDFFYFNDFYLISVALMLVVLFAIFQW